MHNSKTLKIIGKTVLVMLFLFGLAFMCIGWIKNHARQSVSKDAVKTVESVIEDGGEDKVTFEVPISDFLAVDGELGEDDTTLDELMREMSELSSNHETLTLIGILEIPCLEVKEPIWDSCSSTALRFGVGRFPQTANIGDEANCTIFGHRMRQSKTIFWQLQTLEKHIGEEVIVTTTDGIRHTYKIYDTVYVKDAAIDPYLTAELFDTEHLCLATCGYGQDPYNKKIYRAKNTEFIVICVPAN
ncbi:MAG: sortase [Clostridiales bacterium]|nr:sortase [Clostridiales bacterium]